MRGELEVLIKLIIPAILLIFWALSNLFNRESAAQAKGQSPLGPRPPGYPGARPPERARPPSQPPRPGPSGREDDVMIIRAEPNRPGRAANPQQRRNPGRGRNPQQAQGRKPDAVAARPREQLGGRISSDVSQSLAQQMDIRPLSESTPATVNEMSPSVPTMAAGTTPPSTIFDLRTALATQGRIREAFLLNEVLQPPMALRNRGRGRR